MRFLVERLAYKFMACRLSLAISSLTTTSDLSGCESNDFTSVSLSEVYRPHRSSATLRLLEVEGVDSDVDERVSHASTGSCQSLSPECATNSTIRCASQSDCGAKCAEWGKCSGRGATTPLTSTESTNDVAQRTLLKMQGFMNRVRDPYVQPSPGWVLSSAFEEGVSRDW